MVVMVAVVVEETQLSLVLQANTHCTRSEAFSRHSQAFKRFHIRGGNPGVMNTAHNDEGGGEKAAAHSVARVVYFVSKY